jgi:hypothetical protein
VIRGGDEEGNAMEAQADESPIVQQSPMQCNEKVKTQSATYNGIEVKTVHPVPVLEVIARKVLACKHHHIINTFNRQTCRDDFVVARILANLEALRVLLYIPRRAHRILSGHFLAASPVAP